LQLCLEMCVCDYIKSPDAFDANMQLCMYVRMCFYVGAAA